MNEKDAYIMHLESTIKDLKNQVSFLYSMKRICLNRYFLIFWNNVINLSLLIHGKSLWILPM